MTSSRDTLMQAAIPLAIMLFGFALRMQGVDSTSLWLDEAYSWEQSSNTFLGMLDATRNDNYPPLHNVLLYVFTGAFGDSEFVLRMPSVLLGTATIYVVYMLGRDMFGRTAGIIASLLLAVSVFHIWQSIEARMYALLGFTTSLYVWSALHARGTRLGPYLFSGFCAVLMLYSQVFGMFNFIAVNLALLLHMALERERGDRSLGRWLVAQGVAVLLFVPWALFLLERLPRTGEYVSWIADPTPDHLATVFIAMVHGKTTVWALLLVGAAALFAVLMRRPVAVGPAAVPTDPQRWQLSVLMIYSMIVVPFLIAMAISLLVSPIIVPRYMMGGLPMFHVLVGCALTEAFRQPLLRAGAVGFLMATSLPYADQIARPDWRKNLTPEFARFEELRQPGDLVAFVPFRDPTFEYYVRDRAGLELATFEWFRGQEAPPGILARDRVWVFALLQHRNTILPLMDQLVAAGYTEEVASGTDRWVFSLFTRTGAAAGP